MKWRIFAVLMIAAFAYADISLNANITALKADKNVLFIGTDAGEVIRLNLSDKKPQMLTQLPRVRNYFDNELKARIFGIDSYNNAFLLLSEGDFGAQNISICKKFWQKAGENLKCATIKSPFTNIKKAFFIDENTALLAFLSSEIKLVNLKDFAEVSAKRERTMSVQKEFKFSHTSLNDIVISADKTKVLAATESGELQIFDLKAWKLLANYDKINKDTLDNIDFKNGTVLSCGKESKIGIVRNGKQKFEQMPFLTYSCALSPSGQIAAYSMLKADNKNSTTTLIQTQDFKERKTYENGEFFAKFIIFLSDSEFIAAGGNTIRFRSVQ